MKVGAEPKKLAVLGGLFVLLVYFLYTNVIAPTPDVPAQAARRQTAARAAAPRTDAVPLPEPAAEPPTPEVRPRPGLRPGMPAQSRMGFKEKHVDPTTIDPTLRLDLLAQLQAVKLEGGDRNLFQFGAAPLPKMPEPKVVPKPSPGVVTPAAAGPPQPPPPPRAPPVPLKFYGYSAQPAVGPKRAFFLDGDEIIVAVEGQTMKSRYKVVHIGINSVDVMDLQFQDQQTLKLEEPAS
jgi:hypothetical protein